MLLTQLWRLERPVAVAVPACARRARHQHRRAARAIAGALVSRRRVRARVDRELDPAGRVRSLTQGPGRVDWHRGRGARASADRSEWVELALTWVGGHETRTRFRLPVAKLGQLEGHDELMARIRELRRNGFTATRIAEKLNAEGWVAPTQRNGFNERLIHDARTTRIRAARSEAIAQRRSFRMAARRPCEGARHAGRHDVRLAQPRLDQDEAREWPVGRDSRQGRAPSSSSGSTRKHVVSPSRRRA